jgi:hypothetical protein
MGQSRIIIANKQMLLQSPNPMNVQPQEHHKKSGIFWTWYEKHYVLNVTLAACLFTIQLVHLYWLTTDVVFERLIGESFFSPTPFWEYVIIAVDYTEIPALITTSILYLHELKIEWRWGSIVYLILINSQWFHIFWITDEFVISQFREAQESTILPTWLAWIAIVIDYLELPVIIDTIRKAIHSLRPFRFRSLLKRASGFYVWRR